jgi:hypothetical protein
MRRGVSGPSNRGSSDLKVVWPPGSGLSQIPGVLTMKVLITWGAVRGARLRDSWMVIAWPGYADAV